MMPERPNPSRATPAAKQTRTQAPEILNAASAAFNGLRGLMGALSPAVALKPRLIFAVDATASRQAAWNRSKQVVDALFNAMPGDLDVALAVHGGDRVHTWTEFRSDPKDFRAAARAVECQAGRTRLNDIMQRTAETPNAQVLLYIGDMFEESAAVASDLAARLADKGTRVIFLLDGNDAIATEVFGRIAKITHGCVLPFDSDGSLQALEDTITAISMLAGGGIKALATHAQKSEGAQILLQTILSK